MNIKNRPGSFFILFISMSVVTLCAFINESASYKRYPRFPYDQNGLTDRQAAAHLLSRFTYGATPDQIETVLKIGLENWFQQQLNAAEQNDNLNQLLSNYTALKLSNADIVRTYPRSGKVRRMAITDGAISKDSVKTSKVAYRSQLRDYMDRKGFQPERELIRQFINQKIMRSVYSNNQLQEVLTEFWLNHFNVSFSKGACSQFIPDYERDVIRPNALGKFEDLLLATAKSPAMLLYLDNFSSVGVNDQIDKRPDKNKKMKGLNENYAREVMELHTLGVDGGYTQTDVTEAARILTGWTIYPMGSEGFGNGYNKLLEHVGEYKLRIRGFVHEGDFLFAPNRHDSGEKVVLGKHFAHGGGYEEGVELLKLLANHPSAAKFISKKIAIRFVSDVPPASLIDKMAITFKEKKGDIKQILLTLVSSPEFWNAAVLRAKTKSPFELTISSIRALNANVDQPYQLFNWITRMGQQLYYYQAPTGFPDKGQYWINTGALLNRMNFGLALADKRIPGVTFDLLALNKNREPESAESALMTYSKILMPERNMDETTKRLSPLLNDPNLQQKVNEAANHAEATSQTEMGGVTIANDSIADTDEIKMPGEMVNNEAKERYRLSQVVGILIGSPEFQRR